MPTVLVVDVSLSMARHSVKLGVKENSPGIPSTVEAMTDVSSSDSAITKKALAVRSVYKFLDSLGHHAKLEYVSLVSKISVAMEHRSIYFYRTATLMRVQ